MWSIVRRQLKALEADHLYRMAINNAYPEQRKFLLEGKWDTTEEESTQETTQE